jgi:hypothetical protein
MNLLRPSTQRLPNVKESVGIGEILLTEMGHHARGDPNGLAIVG